MTSGSNKSVLVVIRGNSASGKTSLARYLRDRYGRGCALVEQDYLRRTVLREHDHSSIDGVAAPFIATNVRFLLANGYHVIVEGILASQRYGAMLHRLIEDHSGRSYVYYLDVSLPETLRRHQLRPLASKVSAELMASWYQPRDLLGAIGEQVIAEPITLRQSAELILQSSGLMHAPAITPCPARCARCRHKHLTGMTAE